MVGAPDEEATREGRQHILQEWVAKLFSTNVFPTLVDVGVERNNYLKDRRAAAKEKIAKEEQRRLEEARKKDAQRGRVLDGGVAAHQHIPSRMGKSRPNPRRRRAGLARPLDAEPEWKRQRLAQVSSTLIPPRERFSGLTLRSAKTATPVSQKTSATERSFKPTSARREACRLANPPL